MEIPDLRHYASPQTAPFAYMVTRISPPWADRYRDDCRYAVVPSDLEVRAVGWLGSTIPTRGVTPPDCIDRLVQAIDPRSSEVIQDLMRGYHECEICGESRATISWRERDHEMRAMGHHLVRRDRVVYFCPQFILHYVLHHEYCPPDEFVDAVRHGRFLTGGDLILQPENWQPRSGASIVPPPSIP